DAAKDRALLIEQLLQDGIAAVFLDLAHPRHWSYLLRYSSHWSSIQLIVIPAKAGIHLSVRELFPAWIPACAGMTVWGLGDGQRKHGSALDLHVLVGRERGHLDIGDRVLGHLRPEPHQRAQFIDWRQPRP